MDMTCCIYITFFASLNELQHTRFVRLFMKSFGLSSGAGLSLIVEEIQSWSFAEFWLLVIFFC